MLKRENSSIISTLPNRIKKVVAYEGSNRKKSEETNLLTSKLKYLRFCFRPDGIF